MSLDPRIEAIRKEYGLSKDDFWELPQKRGQWCVKHAALEVVAAKAKVQFGPPQVLEANGANGVAAICVSGSLGERSVWSIGEASPKNNKNAYPFAMAEKRAIDRVVLKLVGLHGLVYSEEEADDFKAAPTAPAESSDSRQRRAAVSGADHQLTLEALKTAAKQATSLPELKVWWAQPETQNAVRSLPQELRNTIEEFKEDRKAELTATLVEAG